MKQFFIVLIIIIVPSILFAQDEADQPYINAYVVIADTSQNYFDLREKMFNLSNQLNLKIDTMGRGYNKTKNLICLPDDHEDEIYAGEYYPRRFTSESLSLEYLNYYKNGEIPTEGTIALVVEISGNKEKAELTLKKVKKYMKNAYLINTSLYIGCMH